MSDTSALNASTNPVTVVPISLTAIPVTCEPFLYAAPECSTTYADASSSSHLYLILHVIYATIAGILTLVAAYQTRVIVKQRGIRPLDIQKSLHYLSLFVCLTLSIRAIDVYGWRRTLPYTVVLLAYDTATSAVLSMLLVLTADWMRIACALSDGRRRHRWATRMNIITFTTHIIMWSVIITLCLLSLYSVNEWLFRGIKLAFITITAVFLCLLLVIHGCRLFREMSTAQWRTGAGISPPRHSRSSYKESSSKRMPTLQGETITSPLNNNVATSSPNPTPRGMESPIVSPRASTKALELPGTPSTTQIHHTSPLSSSPETMLDEDGNLAIDLDEDDDIGVLDDDVIIAATAAETASRMNTVDRINTSSFMHARHSSTVLAHQHHQKQLADAHMSPRAATKTLEDITESPPQTARGVTWDPTLRSESSATSSLMVITYATRTSMAPVSMVSNDDRLPADLMDEDDYDAQKGIGDVKSAQQAQLYNTSPTQVTHQLHVPAAQLYPPPAHPPPTTTAATSYPQESIKTNTVSAAASAAAAPQPTRHNTRQVRTMSNYQQQQESMPWCCLSFRRIAWALSQPSSQNLFVLVLLILLLVILITAVNVTRILLLRRDHPDTMDDDLLLITIPSTLYDIWSPISHDAVHAASVLIVLYFFRRGISSDDSTARYGIRSKTRDRSKSIQRGPIQPPSAMNTMSQQSTGPQTHLIFVQPQGTYTQSANIPTNTTTQSVSPVIPPKTTTAFTVDWTSKVLPTANTGRVPYQPASHAIPQDHTPIVTSTPAPQQKQRPIRNKPNAGYYITNAHRPTVESESYQTMSMNSVELTRTIAFSHSAGDHINDGMDHTSHKHTLAPPPSSKSTYDSSPDHWNLYRNSAKDNVNRLYQVQKPTNYQPINQHRVPAAPASSGNSMKSSTPATLSRNLFAPHKLPSSPRTTALNTIATIPTETSHSYQAQYHAQHQLHSFETPFFPAPPVGAHPLEMNTELTNQDVSHDNATTATRLPSSSMAIGVLQLHSREPSHDGLVTPRREYDMDYKHNTSSPDDSKHNSLNRQESRESQDKDMDDGLPDVEEEDVPISTSFRTHRGTIFQGPRSRNTSSTHGVDSATAVASRIIGFNVPPPLFRLPTRERSSTPAPVKGVASVPPPLPLPPPMTEAEHLALRMNFESNPIFNMPSLDVTVLEKLESGLEEFPSIKVDGNNSMSLSTLEKEIEKQERDRNEKLNDATRTVWEKQQLQYSPRAQVY